MDILAWVTSFSRSGEPLKAPGTKGRYTLPNVEIHLKVDSFLDSKNEGNFKGYTKRIKSILIWLDSKF